MKTKKQVKLYGDSAHYWPEFMIPFPVCAALIQVVLKNSEEASSIYSEVVKAWNRPDCQKALNEVEIPLKTYLNAFQVIEKRNFAGWKDPLEDVKKRYRKSKDFKYMIEKINQFILVGFNRKEDQKRHKYRVHPSKAKWLVYAMFLSTFVDYGVDKPEFNKSSAFEFAGQRLDPSTFMDGTTNNRSHRKKTSYYKKNGWKLRHDHILIKRAELWYKVRVVFSGPTQYCESKDFISEETLDPNDILKKIKECDEALNNKHQKEKLSDYFKIKIK